MSFFDIEIRLIPFKKVEFVVFGKTNSHYVEGCLNLIPNIKYQIVDISFNTLYLFIFFSPKFYFNLFKMHKFKLAYLASILSIISPKKVVTFIDNNPIFYELSLIFRDIKFFSIQNGNHFFCSDKSKGKIDRYSHCYYNFPKNNYPVTYMSISDFEYKNINNKCNFKFQEIIPVGSLACAFRYYSKKNISVPLEPEFDIGIIGTGVFKKDMLGIDDDLFFSYIRDILSFQSKLKICYISKFKKNSRNSLLEKAFIDKFFNDKLIYLYKNPKIDNLEFASNCNILISTVSTLLREAFSIGTKIISLNTLPFSHSIVYEKISFKSFPNFNKFREEINYLLKISRKEYFEIFDLKEIDYNSINGKTAIENIANILENSK